MAASIKHAHGPAAPRVDAGRQEKGVMTLDNGIPSRLGGQTAIVTGGASGIGAETAKKLAALGARVVVADIAEATAVVAEIRHAGGEALAITADVSKADDVEHLVRKTVEHYGRLDVAVNNAGILPRPRGTVAEITETTWQTVMDTNLKGVWLCLKHQIPAILHTGKGAIVNVSSAVVPHGYKNLAPYVASKAGVDALTRVAAMEFAAQGIRINSVNPGFVATPLLDGATTPANHEQLAARVPLGKILLPSEVADTIIWLLSSSASQITGQSIYVDGGLGIAF